MSLRFDIPFVFLSPGFIQANVVDGTTPPYSVESSPVQGGYQGTVVFQTDVVGLVDIWEEMPLGRKARFDTAGPVAGTILDAEFDWVVHQIMMLSCRQQTTCWQVLDAADLAAFRAMPAGIANTVVLRGTSAPADGGGGVFVWDENSSRAHDGVDVVAPDPAPATGRYLRITAPYSLP